jgi:hypothetical protein
LVAPIHKIGHIADRICATTFGQICAVPEENVPTTTEPPREALSYDQEYLIAYALHLLNVVAFSMAHETTLQYKATTGIRKTYEWYAVRPQSLPHVINGYYTASSMMHAVTGGHISNGLTQQNKLVALLTTLTNCSVRVTDGTFLHRCTHSMTIDTITKMFCGRAPTDTVWPGVHKIIDYGIFAKLGSNPKGKVPKGVLLLRFKYWLSNYHHTQHIIFPRVTP